jgi:hypothetical protein
MCLVVIISIAATAYLAVFFNRRAKADLQAALSPLAAVIEGEVDLEEAEVIGRFHGQHVKARMANATEGPGRVWQTELLDAAGGVSWIYTSSLPRSGSIEPRIEFDSVRSDILSRLTLLKQDQIGNIADPTHERFRLEYNPESGFLRFIVPMQNRRDIPDAGKLSRQLRHLVALGDENRRIQERLANETTGPRS